jgi:hypothetical protein
VKENVYFVINDTENRIRRQNKKYSEYPDNCGAWQKGKNSTKSHDFILTGACMEHLYVWHCHEHLYW